MKIECLWLHWWSTLSLLTIFLNERPYCFQETLHPEVDIVNLQDICKSYKIQIIGITGVARGSSGLRLSEFVQMSWVFSVLDNRHLADICAFCQKCQFEVRKAWNALFLQLKPHEMHCKQADSAILKIRCGWNYANCEYVLFAYGLLSYSDFKQTRAFVAKRDMSQIRAFSDFFWLRFDSNNCDLTQTLLRHLSQKMMTGASGDQVPLHREAVPRVQLARRHPEAWWRILC